MIGIAACQFAANGQTAQGADPLTIVTRFLSLLDRDETAAGAMMIGDFTVVMGDVGFRPSIGEFRQVMDEIGRDCRLDNLAGDERPHPVTEPAISVIVGHYHCTARQGAGGHDLVIDYFVQGERIAGLYLHGGHGPR